VLKSVRGGSLVLSLLKAIPRVPEPSVPLASFSTTTERRPFFYFFQRTVILLGRSPFFSPRRNLPSATQDPALHLLYHSEFTRTTPSLSDSASWDIGHSPLLKSLPFRPWLSLPSPLLLLLLARVSNKLEEKVFHPPVFMSEIVRRGSASTLAPNMFYLSQSLPLRADTPLLFLHFQTEVDPVPKNQKVIRRDVGTPLFSKDPFPPVRG